MALINTIAQISLISGVPTKFQQSIPHNLKRVTEHKIEDQEICLILITEIIPLPKLSMDMVPIVLKYLIAGLNALTQWVTNKS